VFFGIGIPELFFIALLALIVFGPERLPDMSAKAARAVRSLRTQASKAMADLNMESSSVTKTISDLQSFTPRAIFADVVNGVVGESGTQLPPQSRSVFPASGVRAVFDPDVT